MTSYDTNAQVHRTMTSRKNMGPSIYVGIPERLLDIFLIFFGTYMSLMFK